MIDYKTALILADAARKPPIVDDIYNRMMESVYAEIEKAAKIGQFQYECQVMIGKRGINELKAKGFRINYDNLNEIYKIKWYPRGESK
jgi:hypothetical protein